ncbi:hypothetical protein DRH29_04770 [candidate division Kazan bacterium]|uniref:Uncharacterized protein n=1 Tax=candidate division Kazan bacterium TaxID=2202143 RepID=A0A420ZBK6_UNCK3|nr:MAG: hypothetical protein DRH29_04770 [candidate division Kazan bacterium]
MNTEQRRRHEMRLKVLEHKIEELRKKHPYNLDDLNRLASLLLEHKQRVKAVMREQDKQSGGS